MSDDDDTIALRATVIGGEHLADDYTVIWRDLPIGRIMKRSGVPAQADQWWYGFTFCGPRSLGSYSGTGSDIGDSKAKFKTEWMRVRADRRRHRLGVRDAAGLTTATRGSTKSSRSV